MCKVEVRSNASWWRVCEPGERCGSRGHEPRSGARSSREGGSGRCWSIGVSAEGCKPLKPFCRVVNAPKGNPPPCPRLCHFRQARARTTCLGAGRCVGLGIIDMDRLKNGTASTLPFYHPYMQKLYRSTSLTWHYYGNAFAICYSTGRSCAIRSSRGETT